jgi:hypothetical protein
MVPHRHSASWWMMWMMRSMGSVVLPVLFVLSLTPLTGCSRVSIPAAQSLAGLGRDVAMQAHQSVFVSDQDFGRARDLEVLLHALSGGAQSGEFDALLSSYDGVHDEMTQRGIVFDRMIEMYDAFEALASVDAAVRTESALTDLTAAINDYAVALQQPPPLSARTAGVASRVGGAVADEARKMQVKWASREIRACVSALIALLEEPMVREQLAGFKRILATDRAAGTVMLVQKGLYDPGPLLNDLGADAGLVSVKNATQLVASDPALGRALTAVIERRLLNRAGLIEKGYDLSLTALRNLVEEHEKLEQGAPLDAARLHEIAAQLRGLATLLSEPRAAESGSE